MFNPGPPKVEPNPLGWFWLPKPRFDTGVPNPPTPLKVVAEVVVGPGDETVDTDGDPNCHRFSLVTAGVADSNPGIGGKLSSNDAPNDDDGLKVFKPVNVPRPGPPLG